MAKALYLLAQFFMRVRWLVLGVWIVILLLVGSGAVLLGKGANAPIEIPGTESQQALQELSQSFPQVSGVSAQLVVVARPGESADAEPYRSAIIGQVETLNKLPQIRGISHPFAERVPAGLSTDKRAALVTVQIGASAGQVSHEVKTAIETASSALTAALPQGTQVSYGGSAFSAVVPKLGITEGVGLAVALLVLVVTLGSLVAAGLPILIAIIGVGVSMAGIWLITAFVPLSSVTPMLALMIGLAVGIDYTLFIVNRHREQLLEGLPLRESIARATATAGSAVVFAGLTVMIALVGMVFANIPFLTALGLSAAVAVAIAVLISVTFTPVLLSFVGRRILSLRKRQELKTSKDALHAKPTTFLTRFSTVFFQRWIRFVTRRPLLTVVATVLLLGAACVPAFQLRLALPNASLFPEDDPARITYDLIAEHYGEGANGPLLLAGTIVTSEDPVHLMNEVKEEIEQLPGVRSVPLATPNEKADTGIVHIVSEHGPFAQETTELVHTLRAHHDEWLHKYGVSFAVTGFTAVGIDVSAQLFAALLPFTIFVVGLSLLLLTMVFRSILVPVKATLGYLLSAGTGFGAVVAVFQWGLLKDFFHIPTAAPVLSFMPIIFMGVLFGLAMDYEVFLVSRIHEEIAHGAKVKDGILNGFLSSARVVTAAALIMFAVFAAFIPEGEMSVKTIAFGLAIGIFVDAFIVRMVLVPALLVLLGRGAWWMPRWMERVLPHFDVEGAGLEKGNALRGESEREAGSGDVVSGFGGAFAGEVEERSGVRQKPATAARRLRLLRSVCALFALTSCALSLSFAAAQSAQGVNPVRAAIVNLDKPVQIDGQLIPAGRLLVAQLFERDRVEGFTPQMSQYEHAREELETRNIDAVIVIPKEFSQKVTEPASGKQISGERAQVQVDLAHMKSEDEKRRVEGIVRAVVEQARAAVNERIGAKMIDTVFVRVAEAGEGLAQASEGARQLAEGQRALGQGLLQAADGAGQLAAGIGQLSEGTGQLAAGASTLRSGSERVNEATAQYTGGVRDLDAGAQRLLAASDALASGARASVEGATALSSGLSELATGSGVLAEGAERLSAATQQLNTGIQQYTGVVSELNERAKPLEENIRTEAEQAAASLQEIAGLLPEEQREKVLAFLARLRESSTQVEQFIGMFDTFAQQGAQLAAGAQKVSDGTQETAQTAQQLATGIADANAGAKRLADGAASLTSGFEETQTGIGALAAGSAQLNNRGQDLAAGVGELAAGARRFATGSEQLAGGAERLTSGVNTLIDGVTELRSGSGQLAEGADTLAQKLDEGQKQIPAHSPQKRENLAKAIVQAIHTDYTPAAAAAAPAPLTSPLFWAALAFPLTALSLALSRSRRTP